MFLLVLSSDATLVVGCKVLSSGATLAVGGRPSAAFIFNHTSRSCLCCRRMQLLSSGSNSCRCRWVQKMRIKYMQLLSSVANSCRRVQLLSLVGGLRPHVFLITLRVLACAVVGCNSCRRLQTLIVGCNSCRRGAAFGRTYF